MRESCCLTSPFTDSSSSFTAKLLTIHQPSTINHHPSTTMHHPPFCYTMASCQPDIHASFSAPLSAATVVIVPPELPSLPSTSCLLRRPEPAGSAFVCQRTLPRATMAFRRTDVVVPADVASSETLSKFQGEASKFINSIERSIN